MSNFNNIFFIQFFLPPKLLPIIILTLNDPFHDPKWIKSTNNCYGQR